MTNKEYLDRLKEEDYIAWDSTVNDPMITGSDTGGSCLAALTIVVVVGIFLGILAIL